MTRRRERSGERPAASGARAPRAKEYARSSSRTIDELDPNSSHAKAYGLIPPGSRVLDLGCGSGELASYLAARGDRVWGVDINPAALALAAQSCVETRVADLETADLAELFPGQRFDIVVFADVLEHVREPWSLLQAARSVLDEGGRVVASIPNFAHAAVRLAVVSGAMPYRGLGILDGTHVRFFTLSGVESLFEESGFRLQDIERTTLPFDQPSDLVPDVRLMQVPGDIERHVRDDPEHETLQFVVRAVMLPRPWDIEALRDRLHDVEARSEERAIGLRNLRRERDAALEQIAELERTRHAVADAVREELLAAVDQRDDAVLAHAREVAARRAAEAQLAEALVERDDARVVAGEARGQLQRRDAELRHELEATRREMRHELEGTRREIVELREALRTARERARTATVQRAQIEAELAQTQQRVVETQQRVAEAHERLAEVHERLAEAHEHAVALRDANDRAGEREAHAVAVLADAAATRTALENALAQVKYELRKALDERAATVAAARGAQAVAAETEAALRAALQRTIDEVEVLRARERHDALLWMARVHDDAPRHDDGAQLWSDEWVTR